jgi:hypothetical protein
MLVTPLWETKEQTNLGNHSGRMASSVMLRRVALVRTGISEERTASFIREDAILHSHGREDLKSYTAEDSHRRSV